MAKSIRYLFLVLASCQINQSVAMDRLTGWLSGTAGDREKVLAVEARYRSAFALGASRETLTLLREQAITSGEALLPLVKAQQELVQTIAELQKIGRRQSNSRDGLFSETLPDLVHQLTALGNFVATQDDFARERLEADKHAEHERTVSALESFSHQITRMNTNMSYHFTTIDSRLSGLDDRVGFLGRRVEELSNSHTALVRTVGTLSDYSHNQLQALSAAVYGGARDSHDTRRV